MTTPLTPQRTGDQLSHSRMPRWLYWLLGLGLPAVGAAIFFFAIMTPSSPWSPADNAYEFETDFNAKHNPLVAAIRDGNTEILSPYADNLVHFQVRNDRIVGWTLRICGERGPEAIPSGPISIPTDNRPWQPLDDWEEANSNQHITFDSDVYNAAGQRAGYNHGYVLIEVWIDGLSIDDAALTAEQWFAEAAGLVPRYCDLPVMRG